MTARYPGTNMGGCSAARGWVYCRCRPAFLPRLALPALLALVSLIGGCAVGLPAGNRPDRTIQPAAFTRQPVSDAPLRETTERELGPAAADNLPAVKRQRAEPTDPGAAALVESILSGLGQRIVHDDGMTRISLHRIRNQSRAPKREFKALLERLAGLLTAAAEDDRVVFVAGVDEGRAEGRAGGRGRDRDEASRRDERGDDDDNGDERVAEGDSGGDSGGGRIDYTMHGTAYLISAEGFDQWELFLALHDAAPDEASTLGGAGRQRWQADWPIRVLRQPRPGQTQITIQR